MRIGRACKFQDDGQKLLLLVFHFKEISWIFLRIVLFKNTGIKDIYHYVLVSSNQTLISSQSSEMMVKLCSFSVSANLSTTI